MTGHEKAGPDKTSRGIARIECHLTKLDGDDQHRSSVNTKTLRSRLSPESNPMDDNGKPGLGRRMDRALTYYVSVERTLTADSECLMCALDGASGMPRAFEEAGIIIGAVTQLTPPCC